MLFLAGEFAVRQTYWRYLLRDHEPDFPNRYFQESPTLNVDLSENHSKQSFSLRGPSHEISTNRYGCYDYNRNVSGDYILVVGGDLAWGYVPIENHWATTVETELSRRVVKCGIPGTGTESHLKKAKQVIENIGSAPKLIVLLYENNDFIDDIVFPNHMMVGDHRISRFRWMDLETGYIERHTLESYELAQKNEEILFRQKPKLARLLTHKSALYHLGMHLISSEKIRRESSENRIKSINERDLLQEELQQGWLNNEMRTHLENLKGFKELADWHSANLLVLTNQLYPQNAGAQIQEWLDTAVENNFDVGRAIGAKADRQNKEIMYNFYPYWNKRGNQMAAFEILDYIKSNGVLK